MNVPDSFRRLIDAIRKHHPDFPLPEKIDGVSPSDLKSILANMPGAPEQLFELFEQFDFECVNLFRPLYLLAPAVMQNKVAAQIEFYADVDSMLEEAWSGWAGSTHRCCRLDLSWRTEWIPIGDFNGDTVFIDMDPAEAGVAGQVVSVQEDGKFLEVFGYSIAHWLNRIAENIENGETAGDYSVFVYTKLPVPEAVAL